MKWIKIELCEKLKVHKDNVCSQIDEEMRTVCSKGKS